MTHTNTLSPLAALTAPDRARHIAAELARSGQADAAAFAPLCLAKVPAEDIAAYDDTSLASAILAFFHFACERPQGTRKLRIYNPQRARDGYDSPNTVIETIGTDTPFLIDSCLAALNALSLTIKALWHPVVTVTRDGQGRRDPEGAPLRESMIRVEIDRLTLAESLENLETALDRIFSDVALAVRDWRAMVTALDGALTGLRESPPPIPREELDEALAFLSWLKADHFTFLGYRDYVLSVQDGKQILAMEPDSGLGLLSDPTRRVVRRGSDRVSLSPELQAFFTEPTPLIITKANTRSSVHRRVHMDYIGIKRFDADGKVVGERRFVGLFTSSAYTRSPRDIPYLRQKVSHALARAGFDPHSYDGKNYLHVLETYPRDELFQVSDEELSDISLGIMRLIERPRTELFLRWDKFDRFVSVIVYMPRESYNTNVRIRIADILVAAFDGRPTSYNPFFVDETLARIHYIIARNEGARPALDLPALQAAVRQAARRWDEDFETAATAQLGEEHGTNLFDAWHSAFGAGYREDFPAEEALSDIDEINAVQESGLGVRLYRARGESLDLLRLKLYHRGTKLALSEVLPILDRMGLKVLREQNYPVTQPGEAATLIHDILMQEPQGRTLDLDGLKAPFEEAFHAIWSGRAENDGLNSLILCAGLNWRDVTLLRAISHYLRQAVIPYSRSYMEDALRNNAPIAALIVALFHTRFDPAQAGARDAAMADLERRIETALADVPSLDEDRILRRFANVVTAMQRTTYYQDHLDGETVILAFKLLSRKLTELPEPKPYAEIFVYSPRFEGVHLRFGKVARGGLRWSDRREDFRTEILGLVKAQRVKNAVIVPVGAKGGFVPKQIAPDAPRERVQAEGVACYKLFITSLLALTDNIQDGKIAPPPQVVRHDEDDPYLVVAADKGTASFSDIANAISLAHGFWLGDAFASGGSDGYDHKKMGITARGAWEAVKRHFRELGKDIQTETFTVVGVGDMSGDVFGNGMLLSPEIELVAAFDHRDIFIDPTPDPKASFAERARLFALARSSWADYDKTQISKGGGVFSRSLKAIPLSDEIKTLTGLTGKSATPQDLIHSLLKAEVDLLWFGGIGTFVKATHESHLDVGDRANDAVRIDAAELRAKVVGEGANLGCTQAGRVEYARQGGRINTDAIDNSAGVDTSDHEVNIKILLDAEIHAGRLGADERKRLLSFMQDDVARLVLDTNYAQTRALSISEATAARDLTRHARFINLLEQKGFLNRTVERLPDHEGFRMLETKNLGLTRPELAVLLAYAKMALYESLLDSDVPDDSHFVQELVAYFPDALHARFAEAIARHTLRREIIATHAGNALVNLAGPTFAAALSDETGRAESDVVRAFVIARAVHGIEPLRAAIDALDNKLPAALQIEMHLALKAHLQQQCIWLLKHGPSRLAIEETISRYATGAAALSAELGPYISPALRGRLTARELDLTARGVPADLAHAIAKLELLTVTGDVVAVAEESTMTVPYAARALFTIGEALALDRLDLMIRDLKTETYWDGIARTRLADAIAVYRRCMAVEALSGGRAESGSGEAAALAWLEARKELDVVSKMIAEFEQSGLTIAKLSVLETTLHGLAGADRATVSHRS